VFGSDTCPPHFGACVLVGLYAPKVDDKPDLASLFFVQSCHLPMKEDHKTKVVEWMAKEFPKEMERVFGPLDNIPIIRIGDFNIFMDQPESVHQLEALEEGFTQVNKKLLLLDEDYSPTTLACDFTFSAFPHDCIPGGITQSFLDYCFVDNNHLDKVGVKECFVVTPALTVSDHLPMVIEFLI
jgi:endonuclease/exonuclease/phosphatase family metal-dependent hydrolase